MIQEDFSRVMRRMSIGPPTPLGFVAIAASTSASAFFGNPSSLLNLVSVQYFVCIASLSPKNNGTSVGSWQSPGHIHLVGIIVTCGSILRSKL